MKQAKFIFFFLLAIMVILFQTGCTSIETVPLPYDPSIGTVKIIYNPKVKVSDFVSVMQNHFSIHGIPTVLVKEEYAAQKEEYTVQYTARRSWDFVTYLSYADVNVYKAGHLIGKAHFHLVGKGGFSFYKWDSTNTKLTPMYEDFFRYYPKTNGKNIPGKEIITIPIIQEPKQ